MHTALEEVAKEFESWRNERPIPGITPHHLAKRAAALVGNYPKYKIIQALKINQALLSNWVDQYAEDNHGFIELDQTVVAHNAETSELTLHIGDKLRLTGSKQTLTEMVFSLVSEGLL